MEVKELRKMNQSGLIELAERKKVEITKLRMEFAGAAKGNVRSFRRAKKDLAQILTIISEIK